MRLLHISTLSAGLALGLLSSASARADDPLLESLSSSLSRLAAGPSQGVSLDLGRVRTSLVDLERRDAARRKGFALAAARPLPSKAAGRLADARRAYDEGEGRLLGLLRRLAAEDRAGGEANVAPLAAEAGEIADRILDASRKQPLSATRLALRAPSLRAPADAAAAPEAAVQDLGGPPSAVPGVLAELAATLAGPVQVFEYVRNGVRPEFYQGLMKGPLETFLEGSGNDADTAALLIALLTAKEIPARFAWGTVELGPQALQAATGAANPLEAVRVLERASIPHEVILGSGGISAVRMSRVWAEAYVPYDNYRGTALDAQGKTWVPMDPAFKPLTPPVGIDVVGTLGFDPRAALDEYLSVPRSETPLQFTRTRVSELLAAQLPGTTYDQALDHRELVPESLGILPGVLPYKSVGVTQSGSDLPASFRHTLRFVGEVPGRRFLDVTLPVSDLLGRRLTLSYVPATPEDEAVVAVFGSIYNTPPYLFDVKPVLKSGGVAIAAGYDGIGMGVRYDLTVELGTPGGADSVLNRVTAGNMMAVGLGGREVTGAEQGQSQAAQILSARAWRYLDQWNHSDAELAELFRVVPVRPTVSVCFVSSDVDVEYAGGDPYYPLSFDWKGLVVDADLRPSAPAGVETRDEERSFLLISGLEGSVLEHRVLGELQIDSVSTAKVLAQAAQQGITIYDLTSANVDSILPGLPLDPVVKAEIQDATASGLMARVPALPLTHLDWTGVGYILLDEETGEAAYQLQGGHSGGATTPPPDQIPPEIRDPFVDPDEEPAPPGTDPAHVEKFPSTDLQEGTVNQVLATAFKVLVTDLDGHVIPRAEVQFRVMVGGGKLLDPVLGGEATEVTVLANDEGEAEAKLVLGKSTQESPVFIQLEGDDFETQAGANLVTARAGTVTLAEPFTAYGFPDDSTGATLTRTMGGQNQAGGNLRVAGRFITVLATDPYQNPLSNVELLFGFWGPPQAFRPPAGKSRLRPGNDSPGLVIGSDDMDACIEQYQGEQFLGECEGEAPEVMQKTRPWGTATAYAILGDSPYSSYTFRMGPDSDPYQLYAQYNTWGPLCASPNPANCAGGEKPLYIVNQGGRRVLTGYYGGLIESYPTGAEAHVSFWGTELVEKELITQETDPQGNPVFVARGSNSWEVLRLMDSKINLIPLSSGTSVLPALVTPADEEGNYRARMRMSPTPELNTIRAAGTHYPWLVPYLANGYVDPAYVVPDPVTGGYKLSERVKDYTRPFYDSSEMDLWGIKAIAENLDPTPVLLDGSQTVLRRSDVSVRIEPYAEFGQYAYGMPFELVRNSDEELVASASVNGSMQTVFFPVGLALKPEMHTARLRVPGFSNHAVEPTPSIDSDPLPIPVCQFLDLHTRKVLFRRMEDYVNQRTCGNDARIVFSVCQAARITLRGDDYTLRGHLQPYNPNCNGDTPPPPEEITDVEVAPGDYEIVLPLLDNAADAPPRSFSLKATLIADPTLVKEELGQIENKIEARSVLPVGHTFVKGVDLMDGHVVQQAEDLKLPGRHLGLEMSRTYSSSQKSPDDVMGAGWAWNYAIALYENYECGLVTVVPANGSAQTFHTSDWVSFTPDKGYHTRLFSPSLGEYLYVDKAGVKHHFANRAVRESRSCPADFRLDYIQEPHGDRIVPTFDERSRLIRVSEVHPEVGTTPDGGVQGEVRALVIKYKQAGFYDRISEVSVPGLGLSVAYEHDEFGNLIKATRSGENAEGEGPAAEPVVYQYDYSVGEVRDRSQLIRATDPNGHKVEYRYYAPEDEFPGEDTDPQGGYFFVFNKQEYAKQVIEFPTPGDDGVMNRTEFAFDVSSFNSTGTMTATVRDALGRDTVYTLNRNGSPLQMDEPLGKTTYVEWSATDVFKTREIDALGRVTDYGYDERGNMTSERINTSDLGVVETDYEYEAGFNKMTLKRDPEGRTSSWVIDPATGDVLESTDGADNTTVNSYDSHGQMTSTRDPRNHTTLLSLYDSYGNPRLITDSLGNTTTRDYDVRSRLKRQGDSFGRETKTEYDGMDRPVEVRRIAGGDSDDEVTITSYYPGGQVQSVTNANQAFTFYTLDGQNRVVRADTTGEGLPGLLRSQVGYDAVGNKETETDRRNVKRRYEYDALNRIRTARIVGGVPGEGPLAVVGTFDYDVQGNKLFEIDLAGHRTDYEYDGLYRVKKKLLAESGATGRYFEEYAYDKVGNRTLSRDANGNATQYGYDDINRLVRVENALGQVKTVTYDDPEGSHLNKSQEEDETRGLRTTFTYDSLNRELTRQVHLEGAGSAGEVYTTSTAYDDGDHSLTVTDPRGNDVLTRLDGLDHVVERVVDPQGLALRTRMAYDGLGSKKSLTDPRQHETSFGRDALGRTTSMTDALDKTASYEYDGEGLKLVEIDRRGVRKDFTYDNLGRPRKTTLVPQAAMSGVPWSQEIRYLDTDDRRVEIDARSKQTTVDLDGLGRPVKITDADDKWKLTTYDGVNKRSETDKRPQHYETLYDYDVLNRLTTVTDPLLAGQPQPQQASTVYDDAQNRKTDTDRRGTSKVTQMDPLGRVKTVTAAVGHPEQAVLETNTYDGNSNKTDFVDAEARATQFVFDAANRLSRRTDGFGSPVAAVTRFEYDANGNPTKEFDPRSTYPSEPSKEMAYDELNRVTDVFDGERNQSHYEYDNEGSRILVHEPEGQETTFAYDELGKLRRVTQPPVTAGTPVTTYVYDENRNRLEQTDANDHTVVFAYDGLNRLLTMTQTGNLVTIHGYDANGSEVLLTDPKGQTVTSTYDELNRLKTKAYAFAPGDSYRPWRHTTGMLYDYDPNGNLTEANESVASGTDPPEIQTTLRGYDRLDRLTSEQTPLPDGGDRLVQYEYFRNGTRKKVVDPDGIATTYLYDGKNRLQTATGAGGATIYTYYGDDLLHEVTYPNNVKATHGYDKADRLTSLVNANGGTPLSTYGYTYDGNGNRLTQTEQNGGAAEPTAYSYDDLDRLETVTYPADATFPSGRRVSYGYDLAGNRTREITAHPTTGAVLASKTGHFDALNRLTELTDDLDASGTTLFAWDDNGNQISKQVGAGTPSLFRYDVRDKLVEAQEGPSGPISGRFQYDFEGRRSKKIGDDGSIQYVYDGDSTLLEYDDLGNKKARYEYGSDRLISLLRTDEPRRYYSFDALHSVVNLTDDAGSTVTAYHLDAWGNFRFPTELAASKNRFGFTGHIYDAETDLYFAKARYYDPETGRFTTQDSYLGAMDQPPSLHRYFYGYANPLRYRDPSGRYSWEEFKSDATWSKDFIVAFGEDLKENTGKRSLKIAKAVGNNAVKMVTETAANIHDAASLTVELAANKLDIDYTADLYSSTASMATERMARGESAADITQDIGIDTGANLLTLGIFGTVKEQYGALKDFSEGKASIADVEDRLANAAGGAIVNAAAAAAFAKGTTGNAWGPDIPGLGKVPGPKVVVEGATQLGSKLFEAGMEGLHDAIGKNDFTTLGRIEPAGNGYGPGAASINDPAFSTRFNTNGEATAVGNRRVGPYSDVKSHHIIQNSAVEGLEVAGFDPVTKAGAPAVDLGKSLNRGTPHHATRAAQRMRGGGTYGAERRIGYRALRDAGFTPEEARTLIEDVADPYFESRGFTRDTPTRIPGDRK